MTEMKMNKENNPDIKEPTMEDIQAMESAANFKVKMSSETKNKNSTNDNIMKVEDKIENDNTIYVLNNEEEKNNPIKNLNVSNKNNEEKKSEKKGFVQNAKSWFGKAWHNIKNYDYSKLNLFKQEETEEILDAHGFPMRVPKKKNKTNTEKKDK